MKCVCHTSFVSMPRNFLVTNLCLQIFIIINLIILFILFILNKHSICFRMHCHQFIMLSYEYRVLVPKKNQLSFLQYKNANFQNYCSVLHAHAYVFLTNQNLPFFSLSALFPLFPAVSPLLQLATCFPVLSSPLQSTVNVLGTSSCSWASNLAQLQHQQRDSVS